MPVAESYRLLIADVYELAGASRRTSETIARRHGQSVARWHVMSVLDGTEQTVAQIARRLGLTRQSVARVVDDLRDDEQVSRRPDPSDRRAPLVSLTDRGRDTLSRIVADSQAVRRQQLDHAGVRADDIDEAREVLQLLLTMLRT